MAVTQEAATGKQIIPFNEHQTANAAQIQLLRSILTMHALRRSRPRANGATTTFRRPSSVNTAQRESSLPSTNPPPSSANAYVPPHMNPNYQSSFARSGGGSETRYSKDQLLDLFKIQEKNGPQNGNVNDLFMDGWTPGAVLGSENGNWGKKDDQRESASTYSCWDAEGAVRPISLYDMDDEEREVLILMNSGYIARTANHFRRFLPRPSIRH